MPKVCMNCKHEYRDPIKHFGLKTTTKDGFRCWCKKCEAKKARAYRRTKRGKKLYTCYNRAYKKSHRAEAKEYNKKYRATINGHLRNIFSNMQCRCTQCGSLYYKFYGGRGIKCKFTSAQDFAHYVVDVLKVDPRGLDCDRINNDGHYEPGNIRFVTHEVNCQNR